MIPGKTHGTYTERCDLCRHWDAFNQARVTGWCAREVPRPLVEPFVILMARLPEDMICHYNSACPAFERSTTKESGPCKPLSEAT